jgi:glycosyltransferase involved in cell wall biosynthesis
MLPYRASELFETLQVRHSDAYIGNTTENLAICKAIYKLDAELPNTVILHGAPEGPAPELHHRAPCGNVALFLGRIEPRKGFDVLVQAWELVLEQVPDAKLVVAGEDMPWKGGDSFYQWSLSQVSDSTIDAINYVGFVDSADKENRYRGCDIFTAPSRYESFGLVFLEAMRYGKPIVSCDVGGIPDVVRHGETGLLSPAEDTKSLAKAIIELFIDDTKRQQFGMNAIQDIKTRFSQGRVALETEEFYNAIRTRITHADTST